MNNFEEVLNGHVSFRSSVIWQLDSDGQGACTTDSPTSQNIVISLRSFYESYKTDND